MIPAARLTLYILIGLGVSGLLGLASPATAQGGPRVAIASAPPNPNTFRKKRYPWKQNITATVFWVGEQPTARNPTPNHQSSWDQQWQKNFGGFDNPDPRARSGYLPKAFTPGQNPFYVALPYNDCLDWRSHKPEARRVIPWFRNAYTKPGKTVCKGRWLQIYSPHTKRSCFAQWEDCGPFTTDDYRYVFGKSRPKNRANQGAGIDLSPAVRDHLKIGNKACVHWRFVEYSSVPKGPWCRWGKNNPFQNPRVDPDRLARQRYFQYLRKKRNGRFTQN